MRHHHLALLLLAACGGGSPREDDAGSLSSIGSMSQTGTTTTTGSSGGETTIASSADSSTTAGGCGFCFEPNQMCVDGMCVETCQGREPDPCGPDQVCDVISGTCKDPASDCTLAGASEACGTASCGPGSVCNGVEACVAIAPCTDVVCTTEGACWGSACSCERAPACDDPELAMLNGPFAADIVGIDFDDDCSAWAVTLSGGQEFLRRMTPGGVLTEWGGIGDYDMGEVRVLRSLVPPALKAPIDRGLAARPVPTAAPGDMQVALTYICCPTCGDCTSNPLARGVAHLVEDDPMTPLPIVIFAEPTQGMGPFGEMHLDSGPQGLVWGNHDVLYVGNSSQNGDFDIADLVAATDDVLLGFGTRVTASAAVSPVHILVALEGGELRLLNTSTVDEAPVVDLMRDVTSLSQDPFTGLVYAGLADLSVVSVAPFTGDVQDFDAMPGQGRVAVSPSGNLWFVPAKYLQAGELSSWALPQAL